MTIRSFDNVLAFAERRESGRLNRRELISVRALTAYVAHNQNIREQAVHDFVATEFGVADLAALRRRDFERVIVFLTDLRCDLLTN